MSHPSTPTQGNVCLLQFQILCVCCAIEHQKQDCGHQTHRNWNEIQVLLVLLEVHIQASVYNQTPNRQDCVGSKCLVNVVLRVCTKPVLTLSAIQDTRLRTYPEKRLSVPVPGNAIDLRWSTRYRTSVIINTARSGSYLLLPKSLLLLFPARAVWCAGFKDMALMSHNSDSLIMSSVLPFSKLNKIFFGYFDPEIFF